MPFLLLKILFLTKEEQNKVFNAKSVTFLHLNNNNFFRALIVILIKNILSADNKKLVSFISK
jgi:hypothetical protein